MWPSAQRHMTLVNEWVINEKYRYIFYIYLFPTYILLEDLITFCIILGFCLHLKVPSGLINLTLFTKQLKLHSLCLVIYLLKKKRKKKKKPLLGRNCSLESLISTASPILPPNFFNTTKEQTHAQFKTW